MKALNYWLFCQVLQHALKWLLVLQSHTLVLMKTYGAYYLFPGCKDQAEGMKSHNDVAKLVTLVKKSV